METNTFPFNPAADDIVRNAAFAPTDEELQRKELVQSLLPLRISVKDEYPPEVCLLQINDIPFFAKGDIHAIKAKQKQGKPNAISLMVAAILGGSWGKLKSRLDGAKVMLIDTEQKGADAQLIYNRIFDLARLPKEDIFHRFQMFRFRSLDTQQKLDATRALITEYAPDIVFIDGIVDLMGNFNEVDDSKLIIEELMRLSTKEVSGIDTAIVCVLHTNKATEDHNMRGHAGTMLSQKAGNVLEVVKNNGIMTVRNSDSRHQEVPEWSFMFNAEGTIVDADEEKARLQEEAKREREEAKALKEKSLYEERKDIVIRIIKQHENGISRKMLITKLRKEIQKSDSLIKTLIKKMIDEDIIIANKFTGIIIMKKTGQNGQNGQ